jgi:hypothetical protein
VSRLDPSARIELLIVASGARRDLGDDSAAISLLEVRELDSSAVRPWTARLWYAYADALAHAGRTTDAIRWFTAVSTIDDGETDADERLESLTPTEGPEAD